MRKHVIAIVTLVGLVPAGAALARPRVVKPAPARSAPHRNRPAPAPAAAAEPIPLPVAATAPPPRATSAGYDRSATYQVKSVTPHERSDFSTQATDDEKPRRK